ncbi:TIGR04219 family outer membrane beta-barrel protein [Alcanivorax jadensis]|uniref:TIGR04219 family outer membrane beta-barrel protein n=1 Tax=Alcanivorax jadensis TaxID=64988 RepID=UPI0026EDB2A9|nr:TIGR04219 family outer membrane beta-barrel protein [Alcanivorax jadensis]
MKYLSPALTAALLAATSAAQAAPLVDVYGGAYTWETELEGTVASGDDQLDMEEDLGFDESDQNVFYLGVEHAVPVVPNVRVRYMDLSDSASNRLERVFTFNGQPFLVGEEVRTDFDLEFLDGTFYYSPLPLDNVLKLDLGLTVRRLDGQIQLESTARSTMESASATFPMAHAAVRFKMPLTGLYVGAEGNAISYDGSSMSEYHLRAGWRSELALGVEVGYSRLNVELDDVSDLDADLEIGGPYIAASLSF